MKTPCVAVAVAAGFGLSWASGAAAQVSEVRAGVGWHDPGAISVGNEDGVAGNIEVLFDSPAFMEPIWSPRPHLGATITGGTSQAYAGLSFEWDLNEWIFAGFSVGGMVHTGALETNDPERASLGSRVLFRESITLGVRIDPQHSVSVTADHSSNAFMADHNEGLDTLLMRYGYRF
jgi:lipid A 3-O-deacylase